jgi:hypothetical protein
MWSILYDCVGTIDGTHVLARVTRHMQPTFMGRKHTMTQNVLTAIDLDLRFTYVLAGWEGSAHDALILTNALERPNDLSVHLGTLYCPLYHICPHQLRSNCVYWYLVIGKFYLVDAGYADRPGFLLPYRAIHYHLQEYDTRNPQN